MAEIVCIYHGNCADGFTSAWVLRNVLGEDNVEFYAGVYGEEPPDVTDKTVYILDFSYKRAVMEKIVEKSKRVIHIDHHDSAIRDMHGFVDSKFESYYSYENTESGAMLTWMYFLENREPPSLISHVDDGDRWQFKIPNTREVMSNIFSYKYTFENWDKLMALDHQQMVSDGTAIERKLVKDVEELADVVVRDMNIAGYIVPVANVPYQLGSKMCNLLCKNQPFSAYYYDTPELRFFGLRSDKGAVDVAKIAELYGGGGHMHASGFRVTREQAKAFEIE